MTNKAADLTLSAEEKRRKAAQTGLSEEAKFNDDRHAMIQRLSQAKEALNEKDLDSFRRYIAEAERLNDELGVAKEFDSGAYNNRVGEYQFIVDEILQMQLAANEQEKAAQIEASNEKIANIQKEKEAITSAIEAQKSLYEGFIELKNS